MLQFNCIKDDFYPGFCECLQKSGITALIYDPRNTGTSGGFPRNDIDPIKQVEDYSDAFIYLSTLPIVDSSAIVFWGVSFSGAIVIAAAAIGTYMVPIPIYAMCFTFLISSAELWIYY
jgi:hypothetical protein